MLVDCNHRQHRGLVALARKQTLGEEIANSLSHGAGLLAAVVGTPVLIVTALRHHTTAMVVVWLVMLVAHQLWLQCRCQACYSWRRVAWLTRLARRFMPWMSA